VPGPGSVDDPARRAESLRLVEQEIRRSQAEALGRVGERLEVLLDRLTALDRVLDTLVQAVPTGRDARRRLLAETAARNRVRDEAARVRHDLIIQREALGIVRHTLVEQRYPVPPRRRGLGSDSAEAEGGRHDQR